MKSELKPVKYSKEKKTAVENISKLFGFVPLCDSSCHLVFVAIVTLNQKPVFNAPPSYELKLLLQTATFPFLFKVVTIAEAFTKQKKTDFSTPDNKHPKA